MTKVTPDFSQYVVPRLRNVAPLDSLVADELAFEALVKHNERFRGTPLTIPQQVEGHPIGFVDTIQVLSINALLHEITKGRIDVASTTDLVQYWNKPPERRIDGPAVSKDVVIFPHEGENELASRYHQLLRLQVIGLLGLPVTPMLISGLKPVRANNKLGFNLERTDFTTVADAGFLADVLHDGSRTIGYDGITKSLIASDIQRGVPVISESTGIAGVYARWNHKLYIRANCLRDKVGGVPIMQRKL